MGNFSRSRFPKVARRTIRQGGCVCIECIYPPDDCSEIPGRFGTEAVDIIVRDRNPGGDRAKGRVDLAVYEPTSTIDCLCFLTIFREAQINFVDTGYGMDSRMSLAHHLVSGFLRRPEGPQDKIRPPGRPDQSLLTTGKDAVEEACIPALLPVCRVCQIHNVVAHCCQNMLLPSGPDGG